MKKRNVDRIKIVSPCTADLAGMPGEADKKHCIQCNKFVFDFSRMSARQIEAVVTAQRGEICARITRRLDGSIVTLEPQPASSHLASLSTRRSSTVVNATLAALLGISAPVTAQDSISQAAVLVKSDKPGLESIREATGGNNAPVSGSIIDKEGHAVTGASVKLISSQGIEYEQKAAFDGGFTFVSIPYGSYILLVANEGHRFFVDANVIIDTPHEYRYDVQLEIDRRLIIAGGAMGFTEPTTYQLFQRSDVVALAEPGSLELIDSKDDIRSYKTILKLSSIVATPPLSHGSSASLYSSGL